LSRAGFDAFCEARCRKFYQEKLGRPSLAPGTYSPLAADRVLRGDRERTGIAWRVADSLCLRRAILKSMTLQDSTPRVGNDPKSVVIHLTTGTGMEIEWKDGHRSVYTFAFLRDACPCALCEEERTKTGRKAGEAAKLAPGALPMFKPAMKALSAEAVGKYALKFSWNDKHDLGIYSWFYLREVCPCGECARTRTRV
jgi:DUF971 family protein